MPRLQCKFCDHEFTTKSNLNQHQKRAKYCLEIQGVTMKATTCDCEKCGKTYSNKYNLKRHQNTCTSKKGINSEMMQIMDKVLDTLKEVATKPILLQN